MRANDRGVHHDGVMHLYRKPILHEVIIRVVLTTFSYMTICVTLGILIILLGESRRFFFSDEFHITEFFTSTEWQPSINKFGVLPLLNSTLVTSLIAVAVAGPLGFFAALYLSEYASFKVRAVIKPILEVLAGIPTVVYGYFAITMITPFLRNVFGTDTVEIYNTASAGIAIGILITPLICSLSEDALSAVPRTLREAAFGLGATRFEALRVVISAAISGIAASFIIGLSRAIGETMIVAIAAGAGSKFTFNPFKSAETMTGYMVRISGGDVGYDTLDYRSIFAIGMVLFVLTLILNIISRTIITKFRESYE